MGLIRESDFIQPKVDLDRAKKEEKSEQKPDRSWVQVVIDNLNKNVREESSGTDSKK